MSSALQTALEIPLRTRWKKILTLTICLMSFHFLFLRNATHGLDATSGKQAASKPHDTTPRPKNAKDQTSPQFDWPYPDLKSDLDVEEETEWPGVEKVLPAPDDALPINEYVAICMSLRDQAQDINESIVHHYHHHGIRRFYIMDDGSIPPLSSFEYPGVPRSALTFTYQDRETRVDHMQTTFYSWCLERYSEKHTWIAFFDGDEFLETPGNETLQEVLESFEKDDTVGALGVNWKVHTSSGVLTRPPSARKAFNECAWDGPLDSVVMGRDEINTHIKSIVKTSHATTPMNPHRFGTKAGSDTVGENGDIITTVAFRAPITRQRLALHHFAIKSMEEFEQKLHQSDGISGSQSKEAWEKVEFETPKVNCTELVNYEP